MKKVVVFLLISIIGTTVIGCGYHQPPITLRNPKYNNAKISRIMIYVPIDNIELRENTEAGFVDTFAENGIQAVASYKIFSPMKQYSPQERTNIIQKNNIDSYMIVKFIDTSSNTSYHQGLLTGHVTTTINYLTDTRLYLLNVADPIWEAQYTLYKYKSSDYYDIGYDLAWAIVHAYIQDFKKTEHK